jgi:F-type H+-transporting ATPase subunit epsilon
MEVIVIGPEASVFKGPADALVAPAYDGEVGVLRNHAPFMTLLGAGVLSVKHGAETHRFHVQGGFLQVVSNRVRVVAEHVAPA